MSSSPVDTGMAMSAAAQNDLVQRKMEMDALKKRLGDSRDEKQKLREACEGFEAIFVQKMWEQMRKTVPKGYLHSKDQETYQSLFDVELSKKMTSAGGVGLADMLYDQLSQQLENTGRTTSPGSYRIPVELGSVHEDRQSSAPSMQAADLYSEIEPESAEEVEEPKQDIIAQALEELKAEQTLQAEAAGIFQGTAWDKMEYVAQAFGDKPMVNEAGESVTMAEQKQQAVDVPVRSTAELQSDGERSNAPGSPVGDKMANKPEQEPDANERTVFAGSSWHAPNQISVEPRPLPKHSRKSLKTEQAAEGRDGMAEASPVNGPAKSASKSSIAPSEPANWPVEGRVVSGFGWEDSPVDGRRRWNSGVLVAAAPGDPVRACMSGEVVFAGERETGEQMAILQHEDGYRSFYSNIETESLRLGEKVQGGAVFAKVATNLPDNQEGEISSPALFGFELKRGEMALNPEIALGARSAEKAG